MAADKIAALKQTALFGALEEPALRALAERAVENRLARGEVLFVAGDEARGLYVVVEGAVRAFRESVEGREQVIHVERAGSTIAEVPVFDDGAYPSTVAADEDSTVLFIDKRDVRRLCVEYPKIALEALKLLAGRLRRCAELVENLSLHEVDQRLARLLLTEAQVRGKSAGAGVVVELVLTNQQIAARIGSVREVVSRAMARLQQNGLIALEGRRVTVPNLEALRAYAGE
ncbi:MAG TPA: Crp/Fnr family transcriptional regulator [Blastocatellia bacterium]|nr:Crp/Fnr family transcriptional regulator [Blastocatellia bacterium]